MKFYEAVWRNGSETIQAGKIFIKYKYEEQP